MRQDDPEHMDEMLARGLAEMREDRADPGRALDARLMADALAAMPAPRPAAAPRPGVGALLAAAIGGWRGAAALGAAAAAGLFVGYVAPERLEPYYYAALSIDAAAEEPVFGEEVLAAWLEDG